MRVRVRAGEYQKFKEEVENYWINRTVHEVLFHMFWKIRKLELTLMDKQIRKVEKDLKKGAKDTKKLMKMDKKFDKKLAKCDKTMKGKKK